MANLPSALPPGTELVKVTVPVAEPESRPDHIPVPVMERVVTDPPENEYL